MTRYINVTLFTLGLTSLSLANSFASDAAFANQAQHQIPQAAKKSDFSASSLPNYTNHPSQIQYMQSPGKMTGDAESAISTNVIGQSVMKSINSGKTVTLNPKSSALVKSQAVMDDASDLVHGHSGSAIPCVMPGQCQVTTKNYTCTTQQSEQPSCVVSAQLSVKEQTVKKTFQTSLGQKTAFSLPAGVKVDSVVIDGRSTQYNVYAVSLNKDQPGLQIAKHMCDKTGCYYTFHQAYSPDELNSNGNNTAGIWPTSWQATLTVIYDVTERTPHVTWASSCTQLPASCQRTSRECQEPGGTRVYDNVSFTEPCWAYQDTYQCGHTSAHDGCQAYKQKGCQMIAKKCLSSVGGLCQLAQATYSCSTQQCHGKVNICGGNIFCLDGQCYEQQATQSTTQDFAKAGSELAAAGEAAHDASAPGSVNAAIFQGQGMQCDDDALGFSNCCRAHGWGQDIHLVHCSDEEKKLGKLREKGYTYPLGEYCAHRVLGVCLKHKKSFCVFDGLLAKDVQVQGRYQQLGIRFGSAQSPNCRGITPDELSEIDFSKIDFSNFYSTLENNTNVPNSGDIQNRIEKDVNGRT